MTAQWQARNATRILKVYCVYLFFMDGFSELSWNMLHWPDMVSFLLKQVPNLGSSYHPEPASPSNGFPMISMYSLGCPPSNSDHLRIISCFVRWQLLTAENRGQPNLYSSSTEKKASFAPLHIFVIFHGAVEHDTNDISSMHIFFNKDTKPYTKISRLFSPPKKSSILNFAENIHDFRRSDPKICSFNKFLSKKRYGYQGGMWRFVCRCFFPKKKKKKQLHHPSWCNLEDVFFFCEHSQRLFFWWTLISWNKKQFFFLMTWSMKENWKTTT